MIPQYISFNGIFNFSYGKIKIFITTKLWKGEIPFNYKIFSLNQVHGTKIVEIKKNHNFLKRKGDGLFTYEKNIALEIKTADCFPVFLFNQNLIMALHVGWRGAKKGIIEKGIKIFKEKEGKDLKVLIGPGIKVCCYEIKEDVAKFFGNYIEKRNSKIYLDLEKFIIESILNSGLKKENLISLPFCTFCRNDIFYSARKKDKGRIKSWIIKE